MDKQKYRVDKTGRARHGSQRQIQAYVNDHQQALNDQVLAALPALAETKPHIRWVSPLAQENYVEYFDQGFLCAVEHPELTDDWLKFWPLSGPRWDALAVVEFENKQTPTGVILLEAKSHRLEVCGNGCSKEGAAKEQIKRSLGETAAWLQLDDKRVKYFPDRATGSLYQYANRYAYLYFLNGIGRIPTWLVNVYFVNDPYRPTSRAQWEDFLTDVKLEFAGQRDFKHPQAADVFLEARA